MIRFLLFVNLVLMSCSTEVTKEPSKKIKIVLIAKWGNKQIKAKTATLMSLKTKKTYNIYQNQFYPGNYFLRIEHPGFYPIKERISIFYNTKTLITIQRNLYPKPRFVKFKITSDISTNPKNNMKARISMLSVSSNSKYFVQNEVIRLIPGKYIMNIRKKNYYHHMEEIVIEPKNKNKHIHVELSALPVSIIIGLDYDQFRSYEFSCIFFDKDGKWVRTLFRPIYRGNPYYEKVKEFAEKYCPYTLEDWRISAWGIKPGTYKYIIYKEGYLLNGDVLKVLPSEKPIFIKRKMERINTPIKNSFLPVITIYDTKDPVEINQETCYIITIYNIGTVSLPYLGLRVSLGAQGFFLKAFGPSSYKCTHFRVVNFAEIDELAPGRMLIYKIYCKYTTPGSKVIKANCSLRGMYLRKMHHNTTVYK